MKTPRCVTGPPCPICATAVTAPPALCCTKCGQLHHEACWLSHRTCGTPGCGCRVGEEHIPAPPTSDSGTFSLDLKFNPELMWTSLAGFGFALVTMAVLAISVTATCWAFGLPEPCDETMGYAFFGLMALSVVLIFANAYLCRFEETFLHDALTFHTDSGTVTRQRMRLNIPYGPPENGWLTADDITEVHLHRSLWAGVFSTSKLYLSLVDGRRVRVRYSLPTSPPERCLCDEAVAQKVAAFADTTVRVIEGDYPPPREELEEAAAMRALGQSQRS